MWCKFLYVGKSFVPQIYPQKQAGNIPAGQNIKAPAIIGKGFIFLCSYSFTTASLNGAGVLASCANEAPTISIAAARRSAKLCA